MLGWHQNHRMHGRAGRALSTGKNTLLLARQEAHLGCEYFALIFAWGSFVCGVTYNFDCYVTVTFHSFLYDGQWLLLSSHPHQCQLPLMRNSSQISVKQFKLYFCTHYWEMGWTEIGPARFGEEARQDCQNHWAEYNIVLQYLTSYEYTSTLITK